MLTDEKVIDISLDIAQKTPFRINGNDEILYLNISDMGILDRFEKGYTKLQEEVKEIIQIPDDDDKMSEKMADIDKAMREQIDYIFDSNVSEICASDGTMYDPKNGVLRFEHILEVLLGLYEKNIQSEYKKMKSRIQKHTNKYTSVSKKNIPAPSTKGKTSRK